MKRNPLATIAMAGLFAASVTQGATVKNLSTGINDLTGLQLPDGASDTDFMVAAGSSGFVGAVPITRSLSLPPTYVQDDASTASRWIGINSGVGIQGMTVGQGNYTFSTTVDLTGYVPATAVIANSRYAADDVLISLQINGTTVFSQPPRDDNGDLTAFHPLGASIGAGLFHSGANAISFTMYNLNGPMTLRFEGTVTATAVPEPGSLSMLVMAAGLLLQRKRS